MKLNWSELRGSSLVCPFTESLCELSNILNIAPFLKMWLACLQVNMHLMKWRFYHWTWHLGKIPSKQLWRKQNPFFLVLVLIIWFIMQLLSVLYVRYCFYFPSKFHCEAKWMLLTFLLKDLLYLHWSVTWQFSYAAHIRITWKFL